MIRVTIKRESQAIKEITIKGHANFSNFGSDIVCASVSSIVITSVNAMLRVNETCLKYQEENGYLNLKVVKENHIIEILIINMIELLKELEQKYPKNIIIREG